MALTNLPVEDIEALSSTLARQATDLEAQLNALRSSVTRDPNFMGPAADAYDEFLAQWSGSQAKMLESIRGAGSVLGQFAAKLRQDGDQVASAFRL